MHVNEDDLVLHYYGELTPADEARVAGHIGACRECHGAFRRLQQVLMSIDDSALATPELPDGFERVVWARLQPELQRERRGWLSRLIWRPNLGWAAAALAIAIGSFYAGHRWPASTPSAPAVGGAAQTTGQVRERLFLVDLSDHLERSQRILVELVSADDGQAAGSTGERERAEQLVSANRLYRDTAAATGDASVVDLLDQLERVLVEVAASPSDGSTSGLGEVRRRIESGSLLFKVRVVSSDLQERRRVAVRPTGQRSSL
ncbi:MAG: hypothetical protein ABI211_07405 [Vicinamibacterales bacterium]